MRFIVCHSSLGDSGISQLRLRLWDVAGSSRSQLRGCCCDITASSVFMEFRLLSHVAACHSFVCVSEISVDSDLEVKVADRHNHHHMSQLRKPACSGRRCRPACKFAYRALQASALCNPSADAPSAPRAGACSSAYRPASGFPAVGLPPVMANSTFALQLHG